MLEYKDLIGIKVKIHRNLHKNCFSIIDDKTKKVCSYQKALVLNDITFKVSEKVRQKVLKSKKRFVHAFICGKVSALDATNIDIFNENWIKVTYSPFLNELFIDENGTYVHEAKEAVLLNGKEIFIKK